MIKVTIHKAMANNDVRFGTQLAEATGLNYAHLRHIISGDVSVIKLETLDKLCKALDCEVGDLLEYVPDEEAE